MCNMVIACERYIKLIIQKLIYTNKIRYILIREREKERRKIKYLHFRFMIF